MPPHSPLGSVPLTIAALAARHKLPESTARYYCKRFLAYLPHSGQGKRRRYLASSADIFACIVSSMRKHKNASAVEQLLKQRFGPPAPVIQTTEVAPQESISHADIPSQGQAAFFSLLKQQTCALEKVAESLTAMNHKDAAVTALEQALQQRAQEVATLRHEVAQLKTLLATSERIHQQDLDQLRSWLHKMAKQAGQPR